MGYKYVAVFDGFSRIDVNLELQQLKHPLPQTVLTLQFNNKARAFAQNRFN